MANIGQQLPPEKYEDNFPTPDEQRKDLNQDSNSTQKNQQQGPGQTSGGQPQAQGPAPSSELDRGGTIAPPSGEGRPLERSRTPGRSGARGTAAMDPDTRKEVARKGGLAVSRNKQHMAEIGRKGGQSVSRNREHMAQIGRKGGAASRGGSRGGGQGGAIGGGT